METTVLSDEEKKEKERIAKDFKERYQLSLAVQKPFGQAVCDIMRMKGLKTAKEFEEYTGLNRNIYYTMKKPNCNIEMQLVISICIGFKLDTVSTQLLLESAGLDFNMNNLYHRAYLYIIEYYKDKSIENCNKVLEYLGVPASKRLGSYERGAYKKSEQQN